MIYIYLALYAVICYGIGFLTCIFIAKRRYRLIYAAGFQVGWDTGREQLAAYIDQALGVDVQLAEEKTIDEMNEDQSEI